MILINFAHPLTPEQVSQVEILTRQKVTRLLHLPVQFENDQPFLPQLKNLVDQIPYDAETLQTAALLINPPSLNYITALLLAELHGRMGYFPPVIRLRPVPDALPPRFEVAEILNLQGIRDDARKKRAGDEPE